MDYEIWIESDEWETGEWDPEDTNSEVIVRLEDGSEWTATMVTYKNVATIASHYRESGECLGGGYLYAHDLILIDRVDRKRIIEIVDDLLEREEFQAAFAPRDEDDEDEIVGAGDE